MTSQPPMCNLTMQRYRAAVRLPAIVLTLLALMALSQPDRLSAAADEHVVYGDSLAAGWANWSWSASVNFNQTSGEYSGTAAIQFQTSAAWGALFLHTDSGVQTDSDSRIRFAVKPTQSGQYLSLGLRGDNNAQLVSKRLSQIGGDPAANAWKLYDVSLSSLGVAGKRITGFVLQDGEGVAQPAVLVDEVKLTGLSSSGGGSGSGSGSGYFSTLGPGATLPSGADCAGRVRRSSWEPRPENYTANHTTGKTISAISGANSTGNSKLAWRVDGNFTGTTDEIIQWAACKWGFDENIARAVAVNESWWRQSTVGDNGITFGLMQIKSTVHTSTAPASKNSTAFNVDYALAWRRACYEGYMPWLTSTKGDEWGCVGAWFSGRWYDGSASVAWSGANWYIPRIKNHVNNKTWTQSGF